MNLSEAARFLQAQVQSRSGRCPVCGVVFTGHPRRRYCSPACRQKAYMRRKQEKEGI